MLGSLSLSAALVLTSTASSSCKLELSADLIELSLADRRLDAQRSDLRCALPGRAPTLVASAESLRGSDGRFEVHGARLTTCGCVDGAPDWQIRARSAVIEPDRAVSARWPVLWVAGVPVAALPSARLPLGDRRSGLLAPRLAWSAPFGAELGTPLFLTLGPSYDLTVTPGISSRRGPRLDVEARGAPTPSAWFLVQPRLQIDFGEPRARGFAWARPTPLVRWSLDGSAFVGPPPGRSGRAELALDLAARGDPAWQAEHGPTFEVRTEEKSRSRLTAASTSERGGRWALGLHLLQDLRPATYGAVADDLREISTFDGGSPGPGDLRHRFAEARWDLAARTLHRDLSASHDLQVRLQGFASTGASEARFARLDVRPELRWPWLLPSVFRSRSGAGARALFEPWVAGRATAWAGSTAEPDTPAAGARAAPLFGARFELPVGGPLDPDGAAWFEVRPRVEAALIPDVAEALPGPSLLVGDEVDLLGPAAQVLFRLDASWLDLRRGRRVGGVSIWSGHDLGIAGRAGLGTIEATAVADASWAAPASAWSWFGELRGTWSFAADELRELHAASSLDHEAGHQLRLGYTRFSRGPARSSFVAPEELVPSATVPVDGFVDIERYLELPPAEQVFLRPIAPADVVRLGIAVRPWAQIAWDAEVAVAVDDFEVLRRLYGPDASLLRDLRTSLRLDGRCRCWSMSVEAGTARDRQSWDVGVGFELRGLGSTAGAPPSRPVRAAPPWRSSG